MEFHEIGVKHDSDSQKRSDEEAGSSFFESEDSYEFDAFNDDTKDEISDKRIHLETSRRELRDFSISFQ